MLTKEKIDQFYKDVEGLNLRFPVAELHRMTGFSKGQISQVLGKTLSPSDDLIKEFYKSLNKVQSTDSIAIYERIIEEKEARRRDAEVWAKKMEDHYNDMKGALERAQETINDVLKPMVASLKEIPPVLDTIVRNSNEHDKEIMKALDHLVGNAPGTLAKESGKRILKDAMEQQKTGKAEVGKSGKQI